MKLEYVLTACNLNKLYYDLIPVFIEGWKILFPDIKIRVILISSYLPDDIKKYEEHIILFNEIDGITTAFISQYIRLLYPALLNSNNGIIITDIDMIPMNRDYYLNNIKNFEDDKFIYYRDFYYPEPPQYAMCYNIANSKTWAEIFDIYNLEDIVVRIKERNTDFWCRDQEDLYIRINKWNEKDNRFIMLEDKNTGYNRLCRSKFNWNNFTINNIKNKKYSDYHVLRPNTGRNKKINDKILSILSN